MRGDDCLLTHAIVRCAHVAHTVRRYDSSSGTVLDSTLPWQGEVARRAGGVADRFAAVSFTGIRPTLPLLRVPAGRSSSPLQGRFFETAIVFSFPGRAEALPGVGFSWEIGDCCRKSRGKPRFTGQSEKRPVTGLSTQRNVPYCVSIFIS